MLYFQVLLLLFSQTASYVSLLATPFIYTNTLHHNAINTTPNHRLYLITLLILCSPGIKQQHMTPFHVIQLYFVLYQIGNFEGKYIIKMDISVIFIQKNLKIRTKFKLLTKLLTKFPFLPTLVYTT